MGRCQDMASNSNSCNGPENCLSDLIKINIKKSKWAKYLQPLIKKTKYLVEPMTLYVEGSRSFKFANIF